MHVAAASASAREARSKAATEGSREPAGAVEVLLDDILKTLMNEHGSYHAACEHKTVASRGVQLHIEVLIVEGELFADEGGGNVKALSPGMPSTIKQRQVRCASPRSTSTVVIGLSGKTFTMHPKGGTCGCAV